MPRIKMPTHARIKKGTYWDKDNYGQVWCPIKEYGVDTGFALIHPKYGAFAWVKEKDVTLKVIKDFELKLCGDCGQALVYENGQCQSCGDEDGKDIEE